jgi:DNA (cytosine-5)-methyltransferase 1
LDDPRSATLTEYFRLVDELQPRAFLLENVHGISYSGKEEGFTLLLEQIQQINRRRKTNYRPAWAILNSPAFPRERTTSGTRTGAADSPSSAGAPATGAFS